MSARGLTASCVVACLLAAGPAALAADLPPDIVARFTRQVQPLIVNRCAAGACHGGPAGHEPRFERGPASARIDRTHTLANLHTFLAAVGTDRDPKRLVTLLAGPHPAIPVRGGYSAAPLTASERLTIESWLTAVRQAETTHRVDPAVRQVAAHAAIPQRNRYRDLLETASNPPVFEEPAQPQGVIFKQDDGSAPEPPVAPEPPAESPAP